MPIATEPERTLTEAGLSITNQSRLSYALLVFNHSYNGSFVIHSWHTSSFSLHHFGMDWSGHPSRNNQQKESLLVIMTTATSQRLPICVGVLLGHCAIKLNAYFEKSFHSHAHLCANLWKGHSLSRLASLFEFWRMVVSSECLVVFFFVFFVFCFFFAFNSKGGDQSACTACFELCRFCFHHHLLVACVPGKPLVLSS